MKEKKIPYDPKLQKVLGHDKLYLYSILADVIKRVEGNIHHSFDYYVPPKFRLYLGQGVANQEALIRKIQERDLYPEKYLEISLEFPRAYKGAFLILNFDDVPENEFNLWRDKGMFK